MTLHGHLDGQRPDGMEIHLPFDGSIDEAKSLVAEMADEGWSVTLIEEKPDDAHWQWTPRRFIRNPNR